MLHTEWEGAAPQVTTAKASRFQDPVRCTDDMKLWEELPKWEQLGAEVMAGGYPLPEWVKASALNKLVPTAMLKLIVGDPKLEKWEAKITWVKAQLEYAMLRVAEATEQDASEEIDQLIGRVRHWCADSYDDRFYEQHRDADPVNKDTCVFASIRGLSRLMVPLSWSRSRREMSGRHELAIDLGFRCVYVLTHGAS